MRSGSVCARDELVAEVGDLVARIQIAAADADADFAAAALVLADRLTAAAAAVVGRGGFKTGSEMPAEMRVALEGRLVGWEARGMVRTVSILESMPNTRDAFQTGVLSWSQVRAITAEARSGDASDRAAVDQLIARDAADSQQMDPTILVGRVQDLIAMRRAARTAKREEQASDRSSLYFQSRFDGRVAIRGAGDQTSIATLIAALDAHAGPPDPAGAPDARSRAEQRYDALIALAETGGGEHKPRPVVLATLDLTHTAGEGIDAAARILWALGGRAPLLSPIGTQTLLCDADIQTILFRNGQPIAAGTPENPIPRRIRRALAARDQGCRFPGCHAPLNFTDLHHIIERWRGGKSIPDNLIALCRRCHRRIHNRGWTITIHPDATISFRHRKRQYISPPPLGPPQPLE